MFIRYWLLLMCITFISLTYYYLLQPSEGIYTYEIKNMLEMLKLSFTFGIVYIISISESIGDYTLSLFLENVETELEYE
jgi:hypothetical protein